MRGWPAWLAAWVVILAIIVLVMVAVAQTPRNVLTWADNASNETGQEIERKLGPIGGTAPWGALAAPGPDVRTYTDTAVMVGQEYCYRVRAVNPWGVSPWSNVQCRVVPGTPPLGPTDLNVLG